MPAVAVSSPASPQRSVLIVEDNRDGRESLRLLLAAWGHEVRTAENGLQGVQMALDWRPDAALVDIGLPLLDGYEVARRVRAVLQDAILLVALTAYGEAEDREKALGAGFDHHLVKPAHLETLRGLLAQSQELVRQSVRMNRQSRWP
jgi:two-component system, sensor histidine kinase